MIVRRRWLARAVLILGLLVLVVPGAEAQRRGSLSLTGSDSTSDSRSGVAMVSAVDLRQRRLTLDEEVYLVTDNTRITDWNGQPRTLAAIRTPNPKRGALVPTHEVDFIRFEAIRRRGQWAMVSITVLEEPVQ